MVINLTSTAIKHNPPINSLNYTVKFESTNLIFWLKLCLLIGDSHSGGGSIFNFISIVVIMILGSVVGECSYFIIISCVVHAQSASGW